MNVLPRRRSAPSERHTSVPQLAPAHAPGGTLTARTADGPDRRLLSVLLATLLSLTLLLVLLPATPGGAAEDVADDRVPGQLLVRFHEDAPPAAQARARREVEARQVSTIDELDVRVWRVPEHAADRALRGLQRNPHVAVAEHDTYVEVTDTVMTPDDPWLRFQWGLNVTRTSTAWSTSTGSSGVTIAVIDTGLTPSAEFEGKVLRGHNVLDGSADVTDTNGHGTRVASIAGAATDNAEGIAGYCWDCMLLPVKVMESSGTMSNVAKGVVWAADNGADIINLSLGGTSSTSAMQSAVRYAADRDVVLVAAAGNQGTTAPFYPAAHDEVISVAGSTEHDTLYAWSNHGSWVDVAGPGHNQSIGTNGAVWGSTGTSSASPAVAGIVGLARSLDASLSATQVRAALNDGAVPIGSGVRYGRVDAQRMVELLGGAVAAPGPVPAPEPAPGPEPEPAPEPEPEDDDADDPGSDTSPDPAVDLRVEGSKTRGLVSAHLSWSGSGGDRVDILVDGRRHATVDDVGAYTHDLRARGNPVVHYQVCDAGSRVVCSAEVVVDTW